MARRKQESLLDVIADVVNIGPVWLGPAIAGVILIVGWLVLPALMDRPTGGLAIGPPLAILVKKVITPLLVGFVLLVWLGARIRRLWTRRLFNSHPNQASIRQLSWRQFEQYVGEAFRRRGYAVTETGNPAGDGGIDLILRKDGQATLVQCKHWKAFKVGVQPVRELLGVVTSEGAQAGVMVTSGRFTAEAQDFARANRMELIDGDALGELIQSIQLSERTPSPCAWLSPNPPASAEPAPSPAPSPACPRCGRPMVLRTARRGTSAGEKFWGCPSYPQCKGTRPA